jgi:hypothetical protein
MNPQHLPARIVSGGQTGVDQAALSVAICLGLEHGGWCPKGRRCETGTIPARFLLTPMPSASYAARTRQNVIDSDATLILHRGKLTGGTLLTSTIAHELVRPLFLVDLAGAVDADLVRQWLQTEEITTLNIAGPRESSCPGIYDEVCAVLKTILPKARR